MIQLFILIEHFYSSGMWLVAYARTHIKMMYVSMRLDDVLKIPISF